MFADIAVNLIKHGAERKFIVDNDGNSLLHNACISGSLESVKYLLEEEMCNPNIKNKVGLTPVQVTPASSPVVVDIAVILIKHGANPKFIVDNEGNSLLHKACKSGNLEAIRCLLEEGKCDPNIKNNAGLTPLQVITLSKYYIEKCEQLFRHGANPNITDYNGNTPLHKACKSGSPRTVRYLLEKGKCDPSITNNAGLTPLQVIDQSYYCTDFFKELFKHGANGSVVDEHGNTPLHKACEYGNLDNVKCCLKDGKCDPNIQNNDGLTPLQVITPLMPIRYYIETCEELFLHGANPNVVDKGGNTLLHKACKSGSLDQVRWLLKDVKCNPNIKNQAELTPLLVIDQSYHCRTEFFEELIKYGANANVVDKHGNTPLHKACEYGNLDVVKCFLEDGKCDPNIKNNAGLTAIQVTKISFEQNFAKSNFITEKLVQHGANTNVVDNDGNTPLHKACEYGNLEIVKCLLKDEKCDPNIKNNAGLTPLEATSLRFPYISKELVRHGATFTNAYKTFGSVLQNPRPLQPPVKVFVVGNPSTGKSTLTESLKGESNLFGWFVKVSGVDGKTAGIIPHEFPSKKYGCVTLYDFAGQRSYYSSHAAVLRNAIQNSPPIFIIVVSLLENNEDVLADLMFWLSFLNNQNASFQNKPHVIIVGSHADKVKSRGEQKLSRVIKSLPPMPDFVLVEAIPLDCRYPYSDGMSKLHRCLKRSCDTLRLDSTIKFNAHCFFVFLLEMFKLSTAVALKDIQMEISRINPFSLTLKNDLLGFIPNSLNSLCAICDELNDRGHILFLKDHSNVENSWVIIDKAALLSEVTGTIFAPADFKQHCTLASSTGVVPLSKLSHHFPNHNIEMLVAFLYHLEFCREVTDPEARSLIIEHHQSETTEAEYSDTELYFLFPGLISMEVPESIWKQSTRFSHYFGWKLQTKSSQFFTTRLLQVLILRLAFCFALAPDPKDVKSDVPAFQRKCSIWKNGIFWGDRSGVETLVEMVSTNDSIILLMRCHDSNLASLLLLRSKLIQKILGVACELCSRVETDELFVDSSHCTQYPLVSETCFSIQEIAKSVLERLPNPAIVSSNGSIFYLESFLIYEPFIGLGQSILIDFFSGTSDGKISDPFLLTIAKNILHSSHGHEMVIKLLEENITLHAEGVILATNDELFDILKKWRDECDGTYQKLRGILEQLSIFAARNPLTLAGVSASENQESVQGIEPQPNVLIQNPIPPDGTVLDLVSVTTALTDLLQWHMLGLHLGIRKIKLDEIRLDYDKYGQSRQKSEMIDLWLRTDKDAAWEKLCAALELMGEFAIADEIKTKYISDLKAHAEHDAMKSQPESTNRECIDQLAEENQTLQIHIQESETVGYRDRSKSA